MTDKEMIRSKWLPEADAVWINGLSDAARTAISNALDEDGWDLPRSWVDFDTCCGIYFRLRYAKDDPVLFPKGKWATLQRLEELIEQAMKLPSEREGFKKLSTHGTPAPPPSSVATRMWPRCRR